MFRFGPFNIKKLAMSLGVLPGGYSFFRLFDRISRERPSCRFICPGMMLQVSRQGFLLGYMSIYLGGRGAGMAQQFLYHPQVGAALQHMGGEGVSEGMGMHVGPGAGLG
jgi:hypothetical protein